MLWSRDRRRHNKRDPIVNFFILVRAIIEMNAIRDLYECAWREQRCINQILSQSSGFELLSSEVSRLFLDVCLRSQRFLVV